jgi:two-component sensor histidine kinase
VTRAGNLQLESPWLFVSTLNGFQCGSEGETIATDSKIPNPGHAEAELSRLREQLAEAQDRLADLQHLIRDTSQITLGVVSIIANRRNTTDAKSMAKDIRLRLGAIGVAISGSTAGQVEISSCIDKLARETASVFGRPRVGQRLDLSPVHVTERAAVSVALVAVELLTNAYQHAFVDRPFGSIEVKLAPAADRWARLCVADNGTGIRPEIAANWPQHLPGGKHCGLSTAQGLARSLGGHLKLNCRGGTAFEFSFPAA